MQIFILYCIPPSHSYVSEHMLLYYFNFICILFSLMKMSDCMRSHLTHFLSDAKADEHWKWALHLIESYSFVFFPFPRCPRKIYCSLPSGDVYPVSLWTVSHLGCIWDVYSYPWKKWLRNTPGCCTGLHFGCLCDDSLLLFCKEKWVLFIFIFYVCDNFSYTGFCEIMLLNTLLRKN